MSALLSENGEHDRPGDLRVVAGPVLGMVLAILAMVVLLVV